jgi:hypothetical protein
MVEFDRRQDLDIQQVLDLHRAGELPGVGRGEQLNSSRLESPRGDPRGP